MLTGGLCPLSGERLKRKCHMIWKFRNAELPAPPEDLDKLAASLDISGRLARILWQRGVQSAEEMRAFLNPSLKQLAPLEAWPGVNAAAALLARELVGGRRLCVWGDYDVDGISATALVLDFLSRHGIGADWHIPDRLSEGYGLNKSGIGKAAGAGVEILLTVDCGISDMEAVSYAKSLGLTVIISDHHLPAETLPEADAIVNPRLHPCPCPALSGVGVAFFLVAALNVEFAARGAGRVDLRDFLDLVALGTLADVVDLNGQNRILVKNGLLKINEGARAGVAALKASCNFSPNAGLSSRQVVFTLAPRINAAGRLRSGGQALELLLTRDRKLAVELAAELERLNAKRRAEEEVILEQALVQAREQAEAGRRGLVLHSPAWHPGVIGIVASRIVDALHCPTVVISGTGESLKGSGRSVANFDLHAAFNACSELLLGFGGHRMAAGLSLEPHRLDEFSRRFDELAVHQLGPVPAEGECRIDCELNFAEADFYFLKELEILQPFGMGNPEPVFASPPVRVKKIRKRNGFMQFELADEERALTRTAKVWRPGEIPSNLAGRRIRIAFSPRIDRYNGAAGVDLRLKDWKEV
jgi:single-stranded-DNA-specific exonuclease